MIKVCMNILFATGNEHKKSELAKILTNHSIAIPADLGIEFDPEETGSTYFENSYIKALHLYNLTGKMVIADDSGLSVNALAGAPGIYSARFGEKEAGRALTAHEKNELLLSKMTDCTKRSASFVCCMTLLIHPNRFYTIQETLEGEIATTIEGGEGFGYDPIFYLKKYHSTVAQIGDDIKNTISHRALAANKVAHLLDFIQQQKV